MHPVPWLILVDLFIVINHNYECKAFSKFLIPSRITEPVGFLGTPKFAAVIRRIIALGTSKPLTEKNNVEISIPRVYSDKIVTHTHKKITEIWVNTNKENNGNGRYLSKHIH